MKLSTMQIFYKDTPDDMGLVNALIKTNQIGFDAIDFCMCPLQRGETELARDGWENVLEKLVAVKEKYGLDIAQSHLPYPKVATRRKYATDEGCEQNEYFKMMTERAVRVSAALGVKWAIVHPVEYETTDSQLLYRESIAYNHKIYDPVVKLASSLGVGIAFENMADPDGRHFGVTGEELVDIVESFNDSRVGACWDFGHGNRVFKDQAPQLRKVGKNLHATHVDDNMGKDDLHTIPFFGTVNWRQLMPLLKEIGYEGCFNYELSIFKRMPEDMMTETAFLAYHMGRKLLEMAK